MWQLKRAVQSIQRKVVGYKSDADNALDWALRRILGGRASFVETRIDLSAQATLFGPAGLAIVRVDNDSDVIIKLAVELELPYPCTPWATTEMPWRSVLLALHEAAHIEVFCAGHRPATARAQHGAEWRACFVGLICALSPRAGTLVQIQDKLLSQKNYQTWEEAILLALYEADPRPAFPWTSGAL